ncbi:energy-coupling factor ABC transporter ATP-binding protein [Halococcoides cellulosivorans]|uniref:Cobalt ABC transporter n=1 Tax=Halococcoides cellulosivorans TaxID=1679096 RepID=A0A2R4WXL9_9EURY|nr:energy-coupling factor ABC transporter ATP-binding protein [Halococcoides cellulosivorans]AWB26282.1 cobalt ABC transporter [Halococcoides cellulosivorans]
MSESTDPLIDLECQSHTYPDGTVGVHDIEFGVVPDEIVAVVGPNGSGKSTCLEHLNATLVPDDGELVVRGTAITADNREYARSEVGFVFQDPDTQLVAPTVIDDVSFGLTNRGVTGAAARARARDALDSVGAKHLEDRVPHYLSGGEKRLVGLAGVLVLDPSVIVLDEPFAGLDPARSAMVADRLREIRASGISVVLSTHDLDVAADLADRVCVMDDGNAIGGGTPREVFYDAALLDRANLTPPSAVRIARELGLDASERPPVTERDLVDRLDGVAGSPRNIAASDD